MEKGPKFESGWNKDGMIEETVTEKSEERNPLRRAVGMHAFESEEDRRRYMAGRKKSNEDKFETERKKFSYKVEIAIDNVYMEHFGKPSLLDAIRDCLRNNLGIPAENININVSDDFFKYWVKIKATKYGDLEFEFTGE